MAHFSFTKSMQCVHYKSIPLKCIEECSAPGPCDEACKEWRKRLGFMADRERAIRYIMSTGAAYTVEKLVKWTTEELSEWILWSMCCTFNEFIQWRKQNPHKPARNADYGCDVFTLE